MNEIKFWLQEAKGAVRSRDLERHNIINLIEYDGCKSEIYFSFITSY